MHVGCLFYIEIEIANIYESKYTGIVNFELVEETILQINMKNVHCISTKIQCCYLYNIPPYCNDDKFPRDKSETVISYLFFNKIMLLNFEPDISNDANSSHCANIFMRQNWTGFLDKHTEMKAQKKIDYIVILVSVLLTQSSTNRLCKLWYVCGLID